ncbi:hypothetical protein SRABI04_01782 [Chryseobacterium sp. Bi04]|nr:hypothetical protein SRABI04_01782 [Chryseobacterium sp. Bi04]
MYSASFGSFLYVNEDFLSATQRLPDFELVNKIISLPTYNKAELVMKLCV